MCELFGTAFTLSWLICLLYFNQNHIYPLVSVRFIGVLCENEGILTETQNENISILGGQLNVYEMVARYVI